MNGLKKYLRETFNVIFIDNESTECISDYDLKTTFALRSCRIKDETLNRINFWTHQFRNLQKTVSF